MTIPFKEVKQCVFIVIGSELLPNKDKELYTSMLNISEVVRHLLMHYWKRENITLRLRWMYRKVFKVSLTDIEYHSIVKNHFQNIETATRFVMRVIYNTVDYILTPTYVIEEEAPRPRIGVVITTHGNNGVYVRRCIESYYRCVPADIYDMRVILYINEKTDDLTLSLNSKIKELTVVYIEDQVLNGGLTGTWNQGIDWCVKEQCDIVVLSNDDLFVTKSIHYLLNEATHCALENKRECYYGPVSNNPGPDPRNRWQHSRFPLSKNKQTKYYTSNIRPLNGFFMVFPMHVLQNNKFSPKHYFDPSKPFEGNEMEWAERFFRHSSNHLSVVVPQSFVYHTKLNQWRNTKSKTHKSYVCGYTINTGGYEKYILIRNKTFDFPIFYFTDSEATMYNAIQHELEPMMLNITKISAVCTQRTIKTSPHAFLPSKFELSIYFDGNCIPNASMLSKWCSHFTKNKRLHLICWKHPTRTNIHDESKTVTKMHLETETNVNKIISLLDTHNYDENTYDNVLTETNMLIRRHGQIKPFSREWTKCVEICRRDQLSFDFLVHKHKLVIIRGEYSEKPLKKIEHSGNTNQRTVTQK